MADTPQEFNSSPLKSYFPKRRGSSSEASFFRVNMQNFSGVTTTSTTLNGEFPPISLSLNVFFFPNAPHPTLCPPRNKKCESDVRSCRVCKTSVGWMASSVGGARKHNRWGVLLGKYITYIYIDTWAFWKDMGHGLGFTVFFVGTWHYRDTPWRFVFQLISLENRVLKGMKFNLDTMCFMFCLKASKPSLQQTLRVEHFTRCLQSHSKYIITSNAWNEVCLLFG